MARIKFLVMDVDGTLTDGKIYMGQEGELVKAFDIKDGCGILLSLPEHDIVPVIITARESRIVEKRCAELNIKELHQGAKDKLMTLNSILEKYDVGMSTVAYVGDDLPDIPCMEAVKKSGGVVLCPADAIQEIKVLADYVSGSKAGEGAIRDCINYLIQAPLLPNLQSKIIRVISLIQAGEFNDQPNGTLPDGTPYSIQEYITKEETDGVLESHRFHIDVQYMISGHEQFKVYSDHCLTSEGIYEKERDTEFWKDGILNSHSILVPGSIIVVMNNQPHKGAIQMSKPEKVRKLVCKISV